MPYIFPRRVTRGNQVPDVDDFNDDIVPAAEKISGHLNAHDFDGASLRTNVTIASDAYYKPYYKQQSSDPGWGSGGSAYAHPTVSGLPASADKIVPNGGWTALTEISHTNVSIGNGNLWIVGWAQYVLHGFTSSNAPKHAAGQTQAAVQFALRVDGEIIPSSVTGHVEEWIRPVEPLIPVTQRNATSTGKKRNPGPGYSHSSAIRGCGPHAMPVRLTCSVPVVAGTHTVEMVARVVGNVNKNTTDIFSFGDVMVAVHNRKLFVLGCPMTPSSAPTRSSTQVPALQAGSSISNQTFYTDRVEKLKNAYNDISDGDLARGALQHHHLPNTYLDQVHVSIAPSSAQTINCLYPGFGDDTVSGTKASGANGWWRLDDGGGSAVFLQTDNDATRPVTEIDRTTENSWIIVMANVQLQNIKAPSTPNDRLDRFAAFSILDREDTTGTYTNRPAAECYVNRFTRFGTAGTTTKELALEIDVPLFHVYDYSTGSLPANDLDYISVVGSGFDLTSLGTPASPDVLYLRGSLTVIQLRA